MATDTKTTWKPVTVSYTVELILNALPPDEQAVVNWNIHSPERIARMAEHAVVVPRTLDDGPDLLVADVAPSVVLVFQETPTHFELLDLVGKRLLNWKKFPPPADQKPALVLNGHTDALNWQAPQ